MASAKSLYLKQMHSMEPEVSSSVNVAMRLPVFVSFVVTPLTMPTKSPLRISFVRSDSSPMVNFDMRASMRSYGCSGCSET